MTSTGIYRPVAALVGRSWGIAAAFLASGILHELAISVPARAGFGLPLIYFALQGRRCSWRGRSRLAGPP
jgi:alginate O-acetyltransferase complex protein AlgI